MGLDPTVDSCLVVDIPNEHILSSGCGTCTYRKSKASIPSNAKKIHHFHPLGRSRHVGNTMETNGARDVVGDHVVRWMDFIPGDRTSDKVNFDGACGTGTNLQPRASLTEGALQKGMLLPGHGSSRSLQLQVAGLTNLVTTFQRLSSRKPKINVSLVNQ